MNLIFFNTGASECLRHCAVRNAVNNAPLKDVVPPAQHPHIYNHSPAFCTLSFSAVSRILVMSVELGVNWLVSALQGAAPQGRMAMAGHAWTG
ncbi:hypothetical protein E2C01_033639 [Portunus trituberculatus]|uniref:Uncharacterized protein n=1 Tax=Portunus trituberculatus TaxID=210409 RepID=A0A5B7F3Z8_PORTR|nr:hypothetical protein [Portunus trituberculatus]